MITVIFNLIFLVVSDMTIGGVQNVITNFTAELFITLNPQYLSSVLEYTSRGTT